MTTYFNHSSALAVNGSLGLGLRLALSLEVFAQRITPAKLFEPSPAVNKGVKREDHGNVQSSSSRPGPNSEGFGHPRVRRGHTHPTAVRHTRGAQR